MVPKKAQAKSWAYGELTTDDIVRAAIQIIQREGVAKLTMRKLAEELQKSSMISYYYVSSKRELLDLVITHVYESMAVPPPEFGDWRARIRKLFSDARPELLKYPGLAELIQSRPPSLAARAIADDVEKMLLDAGFAADVVPDIVSSLWFFILGLTAWEAHADTRSTKTRKGSRSTPSTPPSFGREFAFGIDIFIRGLESLLEDTARTAKPNRSG